MTGHLEWECEHCACLRLFAEGTSYGEPPVRSIMIKRIGPAAKVIGYVAAIDPAKMRQEFRVIEQTLREAGFKTAVWVRYSQGEHRNVSKRLVHRGAA